MIFKQSLNGLQEVFNSILRSNIIALHLETYQSEPKILRLVFLAAVSERRSEEAAVCISRE